MLEKIEIKPVDGFRFDEPSHTYWVGDAQKPGVTEILKALRLARDYAGVDPFYRDRGKAVHQAIAYFLEDDLDEASLHSLVRPHFDGFRGVWAEKGPKALAWEIPLYSVKYGFAGTIDLILPDGTIVDHKCSKSHDPVAQLQGELYKLLVMEALGMSTPPPFEVWQYPGDGSHAITRYPEGVDCALAVLTLYRQWKRK